VKQVQLSHPQLLGLLDRPIAFHRCFVEPTGSVAAALMLSQALYWQQRTKDPEGWWFKTRDEWQEETGLGRREQETARAKLRKLGVMREDLRGVPAQLWYMVDENRLLEVLAESAQKAVPVGRNPPNWKGGIRPTGRAESAQQAGTNPPNKKGAFAPTFKGTETTTETTTEITTTTPNPSASNAATTTTEPAHRGGRGDEDQKPEDPDSGQELAALETTKEKPVSREEVETTAATDESGDIASEDQKTVASEVAIEAQRAELAFPLKLTQSEYADIAAQVYPLPPEIAQQVLDVIEAKRRSGQIKTNPAAILRGILRKYKADPASFDPSIGFAIADARRRHVEEAARIRAEAEQREREREASRITPQARESAHRSLAAIKQLLRGHA